MAFNKVTKYGESENILDSAVGLVTKTRQVTRSMAKTVNDRKIIKSGSLFTNPDDETDIGVVYGDYDMTDYAEYPISVIVEGRLKKDKVASEVTAKEDDLLAKGIRLV